MLLQLALFVANLNSENLAMEMDINVNIKTLLKKLRGLEGRGGGYIRKQNKKERKKKKARKVKKIIFFKEEKRRRRKQVEK